MIDSSILNYLLIYPSCTIIKTGASFRYFPLQIFAYIIIFNSNYAIQSYEKCVTVSYNSQRFSMHYFYVVLLHLMMLNSNDSILNIFNESEYKF